jgi:hypothetical protein
LDVDKDRRIIHQNIDPSESLHRLQSHLTGVRFVGDIDRERQRFTARCTDLVCYGLAIENIGDDNRRAFVGQLSSVRGADMARATGDDSHAPAQSHRPLQEYSSNVVVEW